MEEATTKNVEVTNETGEKEIVNETNEQLEVKAESSNGAGVSESTNDIANNEIEIKSENGDSVEKEDFCEDEINR